MIHSWNQWGPDRHTVEVKGSAAAGTLNRNDCHGPLIDQSGREKSNPETCMQFCSAMKFD